MVAQTVPPLNTARLRGSSEFALVEFVLCARAQASVPCGSIGPLQFMLRSIHHAGTMQRFGIGVRA
eukprot:13028054-Alexandrium_andersonii.AAC.1